MAEYTKAKFLQDPSRKTPVFVRFSTVAGSRGSSDLARDVRGFAVKFYTEEGTMIGRQQNPVFLIQDAISFPTSSTPSSRSRIMKCRRRRRRTTHFWDFISLMPESCTDYVGDSVVPSREASG